MESKQWRKLPADDFWIKSSFTEDSYSIWLTDLCQLYAEELDADDFRWRAMKAKLPIDIDEPSNLSTVLKRLSEAVNEDELDASSTTKTRHMDVTATVHLPKPLTDIDWTFKLELQEDEKFREAVSRPLLDRIETFEQREDDLVHRLHDKDHAIEKLLDALEKYSVDLADVFPSLASHAASRRAGGRRDAENHIPALKAFGKDVWLESIKSGKRYERPMLNERTESSTFETVASGAMAKDSQQKDKKGASSDGTRPGGIKRTLGSRRPPLPPPATLDTESEKASPVPSTPPAKKSIGIQRTLGSRKAESTVESTTATEASEPENRTSPQAAEKPKGIKRTLASRNASTKQKEDLDVPTSEVMPVPAQTIDEPAEGGRDDAAETTADEEEAADKKRADLRRQFALAATHKSKKRKF